MKMFSIIAVVVSLISLVFGVTERNVLLIISSLSITLGFIFLYKYYQNKSEKFMQIFAVFLLIYIVLDLLRMFTEKGYF